MSIDTQSTVTTPPLPGRLEAIDSVLDFVRADPAPLLKILVEISNHRTATAELDSFTAALEGAREEIAGHRPGRVGSAAVFMPSNVVLYSYALLLLVPSLYVEELTFRPSGQVGDQTRRIHELLAPVHGLPIRLAELSQRAFVEGPAAEADLVTFTGTYKNVETIRAGLRPDQLLVFFGQGVNPFVVARGADLRRAVEGAVSVRMFNSGQDCYGPDVFLVHSADLEAFLGMLFRALGELRFGDYADPAADYGPVYYTAALETASEHLRRHSKRIVYGGEVDFRQRRVSPTVLVWPFSENGPLEEMFAPIFNVVPYDTVGQLHRRLTSPFMNERAMAAMVYGDAPETVELLAQRHYTCVNRTLTEAEDGNRPFGGHGIIANYLAYGEKRLAVPLLLSQVVAEHYPAVIALRADGGGRRG
ncbi:aldehyde dehydrogenase family protein [Streptomyces sp. NPDC055078]